MSWHLPADLSPWAQRVEETYIAATLGRPVPMPLTSEYDIPGLEAIAVASACAVAARFLAVGKPRSLAIIAADPRRAVALLGGHRVWHNPRDLRWAGPIATVPELLALGGRATELAEALTADIVCVDLAMVLGSQQVRRGSHLHLLAADADLELRQRAVCIAERATAALPVQATLGDLAAGLRDGRQLDEITLLLANGSQRLSLARGACGLPIDGPSHHGPPHE
jgi:hypothetical protein